MVPLFEPINKRRKRAWAGSLFPFKKIRLFVVSILLFLNIGALLAQKAKYLWPVKDIRTITGSFGEFRYFYFHLGMDFSTASMEGIPILAITDGEINRLQSLRYSIGNALYLHHSDGMNSRYGHLQRYSKKLMKALPAPIRHLVETKQDFTYTLTKGIPFKKGEVIGYSGKTGMGPAHLHMEIFKDGVHYNPADFGFDDNPMSKIQIFYVTLKPEDNMSYVNQRQTPLRVHLSRTTSGEYKSYQNISIQGKVSIQVSGHEKSGYSNQIGFRGFTSVLNGRVLQSYEMAKIRKSHMRHSSLIYNNFNSNIHGKPFTYFLHSRKSHGLLGYRYPQLNKGLLLSDELTEKKNHLAIEIRGIGSKTKIHLNITRDNREYPHKIGKVYYYNVYPDSYSQLYSDDKKLELFFPGYSVLFKQNFSVKTLSYLKIRYAGIHQLSPVYQIGPNYLAYNLGFNMYFHINGHQYPPEKVSVYRVNYKGQIYYPLDHEYRNPKLLVRYRNRLSGHFVVLADESKPRLSIYGLRNGGILHRKQRIYLRLYDTGSGVKTEEILAKVDGKRVYVDFDPEAGRREIFSPHGLLHRKGKHKLEVSARDRAGNQSDTQVLHYQVR